MLDAKIFLKAIDELEEKGISRDVTIQALKESFESIFKKKNYEDTRVMLIKLLLKSSQSKLSLKMLWMIT